MNKFTKRLAVLATLLVGSVVFLVAGAAADIVGPITFEPPAYHVGDINGQQGWSNGQFQGRSYDANVVDLSGYTAASGYGFGTQALQISDALTTSDFDIQPHSPALADPSSEGGSNPHFVASFSIGTALGTAQVGSHVEVSPDDGVGGRMSYLRFDEQGDGLVHVSFYDVQQSGQPCPGSANFVLSNIATFPIGVAHTFTYDITLNSGPGNDVVKISEDGLVIHTGTSWEDYYRCDPEAAAYGGTPPSISKLLFRVSGGPAYDPALLGTGYLFDNVSLSSEPLAVTPVFAGITFVNTVESGKGKVPNCTAKNPFKTGTADVNAFPNAVCSSDGNAPKPSTFSWHVELANGTPSSATPVTNTGPPITVTVTKVTTHGKNHGQPPSLVSAMTQTIPTGSSATTLPFKVGNIGGGDWIQVTTTVTVGSNSYTLEMQVH